MIPGTYVRTYVFFFNTLRYPTRQSASKKKDPNLVKYQVLFFLTITGDYSK